MGQCVLSVFPCQSLRKYFHGSGKPKGKAWVEQLGSSSWASMIQSMVRNRQRVPRDGCPIMAVFIAVIR
jgi:hypothetical protein